MPEGDSEFRRLLDRVTAGDESAVTELIEVYGPHILRVTRRAITQQLRARFDSQDFVQAVWVSVFGDPAGWQNLTRPSDLRGFLAALARNKVIDEFRRRYQTQSHSIHRECPLDAVGIRQDRGLASREPTPSQAAVAKERWDRLLAAQSLRNRSILQLRFDGAAYTEIAARLKLHERTVRRITEQLFQATQDEDEFGEETAAAPSDSAMRERAACTPRETNS